jgi:hypothetical protein
MLWFSSMCLKLKIFNFNAKTKLNHNQAIRNIADWLNVIPSTAKKVSTWDKLFQHLSSRCFKCCFHKGWNWIKSKISLLKFIAKRLHYKIWKRHAI